MRVYSKTVTFARPPRRSLCSLALLLLLDLLPPGNSLCAMEKLLIVHSALNMFTAPLWMAKEKRRISD